MKRKRQSHDELIDRLSVEQRETYAEYLRERIYSTLTLLAVVTTLWRHAQDYTAWGAFLIIVGTVYALWLATRIADSMSHRIVHGMKERSALGSRNPASGLLEPALAPAFFVLVAMAGIVSLSTALIAGVVALVFSLFLFSVLSGRKTVHGRARILIYSLAQVGVGLLVVWLKIALE